MHRKSPLRTWLKRAWTQKNGVQATRQTKRGESLRIIINIRIAIALCTPILLSSSLLPPILTKRTEAVNHPDGILHVFYDSWFAPCKALSARSQAA